jgi:predicted Rossmann fold flavoprotein
MSTPWDCTVIGAGAAGLHCAAMAGQLGLRVLLIDHAHKVAEKIRISGGGRCNFTNLDVGPANFHSEDPHFCRSALARYTPGEFIALMRRHGIAFHEKHRGQLFCDGSSEAVISMLLAEAAAGAVVRWQPCAVQAVRKVDAAFEVDTDRGTVRTARLVVASGGLSIPKIGATDFGHRLARQFGHHIVPPRPALVPLTFEATAWAAYAPLAGVSLEVAIETGHKRQRGGKNGASGSSGPYGHYVEDLLFTHRGLSGPAVLQVSSHWQAGQPVHVDLAPGVDVAARLREAKAGSRRHLGNELGLLLPQRLADVWLARAGLPADLPMPQVRDRDLDALAERLTRWALTPSGSEGWRKAEVTAGGVATRELSSQSMESRLVPGLHFIGEVVDVTGWLGGYNFQWAWASAAACARAMADGRPR